MISSQLNAPMLLPTALDLYQDLTKKGGKYLLVPSYDNVCMMHTYAVVKKLNPLSYMIKSLFGKALYKKGLKYKLVEAITMDLLLDRPLLIHDLSFLYDCVATISELSTKLGVKELKGVGEYIEENCQIGGENR